MPAAPAELPPPAAIVPEAVELLRQLLEVQREQLAYQKAAAAAHDHTARWRAYLARWQEEFPGLGDSCRKAMPHLERCYGQLIHELTERLTDEDDPLGNDFGLQEFLDRYGVRLAQLGTILNLVAIVTAAVTALLILLAPLYLGVLVHYHGETLALTIDLTRLVLPSLFILGLFAVGSALLYALRSVVFASWASGLYHIGIILGAAIGVVLLGQHYGIYGAAVAAYVLILSGLIVTSVEEPSYYLIGFGLMLAVWARVRRQRLEHWQVGALEYEELAEPAVQTLAIYRD